MSLKWFNYEPRETILKIVGVENEQGETISSIFANPFERTASIRAWAGARESRSSEHVVDILKEMKKNQTDADKRIETFFVNYGHASVADMARFPISFHNVPMHFAFTIFNLGYVNSGQEKSTRYQTEFEKVSLDSLLKYLPEEQVNIVELYYQKMLKIAHQNFAKHKKLITENYEEYYKPSTEREQKSLESRVLDTVRYFLLFGQRTGLMYEDSARNFSKIISTLKASPLKSYQLKAQELQTFLTPSEEIETEQGFKAEAPSLIRHAEKNSTVNDNLQELKKYLIETKEYEVLREKINPNFLGFTEQSTEIIPKTFDSSEKIISQYLLTMLPGLHINDALLYSQELSSEKRKEISKIITKNHNRHKQMPEWSGVTDLSIIVNSDLGALRDWNRHRAMNRFVNLPITYGLEVNYDTVQQIINHGYGLASYLTDVEEFSEQKQEFIQDMDQYYQELNKLVEFAKNENIESFEWVINLLPLAHNFTLIMHANPLQIPYMTELRARNGGHINYRKIAWDINQEFSDMNEHFNQFRLSDQPLSKDRTQFFDRS